ncbi:MAG: hypothetical protein CL609_01235 [Anaerolineaceae bacterium]|nr:hypothetical protein [Anaerolineaceae bacterium]
MSLPIHRPKTITQQVNAVLRDRIRDNVYPPGSRLPSESLLCSEFRVSRATVRTALTRLAGEGLVIRKQGDGTYVNKRLEGVQTNLGGLWEFGELIEKNGFQASIQSIFVGQRDAGTEEASVLAIQPGEPVVELKRLFFANQRPVIYVINLIPANLLAVPVEEINGRLSIREILQLYCNENIAYALSEVCANLANSEVSSFLKLPSQTPLLNIHICFYDANNRPIVSGSSYYDDTILKLRLVQAWQ